MESFFDRFYYSENGKTSPEQIIEKEGIRFSVLTPYLLRVEIQKENRFCDEPTQTVQNRRFSHPGFTVSCMSDLVIRTDKCEFRYSLKKKKMICIRLDDGRRIFDFYKNNLGGTCRTLDGTSGAVRLEDGILSRDGVAVLDDSKSLVVSNDGEILQRESDGTDFYFFAYGKHYRKALFDYFRLTGMPPMVPRFALGNWWSRYKAYTQEEYLALMEKFSEKGIPLTVATVDMDWHWVKVTEKFGPEARGEKKNLQTPQELFYYAVNPGWTGYSWNTDLFPAPERFLRELHNKYRLKVTLNLHPSSGCRFFEDAYADFCAFLGMDPKEKKTINFDITDKKFLEGYFRFLHYPLEKAGVDFWWIDWQQGKKSALKGLDPLWALNHYHYLDNGKNGNRPLILSRYAGPGSHRYPLGFSGDTAQTWSALRFQPYFTANAANIGYTWWSHDIGGHHFGVKDDELYLRWVQFGVFSPIMRLHSTSNEFMGKEPWKYRGDVERYASDALRLRHKLIPYLYTMARLSNTAGRALCEPMYYAYPDCEEAYNVPNQYAFGTELIVCPITEKANPKTGLAGTDAWLPPGRYTDVFTGRIYQGEKRTKLYRDETSIPVLAKAGAIIPLSGDPGNDCRNPENLTILIYRGNSEFTLFEDSGSGTENENHLNTRFSVSENGKEVRFCIDSAEGNLDLIPEKRNYELQFRDIVGVGSATLTADGKTVPAETEKQNGTVVIRLSGIPASQSYTVTLNDVRILKNQSEKDFRIDLISKLQGFNQTKSRFTDFAVNNKKPGCSPANWRVLLRNSKRS